MIKHERILSLLQIAAITSAALAAMQTGLGILMWMGSWSSQHGMIGNITGLIAVLTAVMAYLWFRESGNKGMLMHAGGLAVLALVQIGIGEIADGGALLRTIHIIIGFAYLVGAIALVMLVYRKPGQPKPSV